MFRLNFKIALRNLWKNKISTLINIGGLAIGLTACLLLLLYVAYEWNFDRQGKDAEQVYQVMTNFEGQGGEITGTGASTGNAIGPVLKEKYPAVKAMARISWAGQMLIANGQHSFKRNRCFADPDLLQILHYKFISGNAETSLQDPHSIILTVSTARLLFGEGDVMGRVVNYDNRHPIKVTGVIEDLPENMSFQFDYLMPWSLYESAESWIKEPYWTNFNWATLVRLADGTDVADLNKNIYGLIKQNSPGANSSSFLFPLYKLHLYGTFVNGKSTGGKIEQVRLFMGLAVGILLIACINFMNMATAKSERRAREVGIKKTIGASRASLVKQFLMESMLSTVLSTILSIILIELFMPVFNQLLAIDIDIAYAHWYIWAGLGGVILLTGIISGSYPAFYLSAFDPVLALKKRNIKTRTLTVQLRQILVVGQFSFAVILIIATAVIYQQIQFLKNRPVGYELSELVEMPQEGVLAEKHDLLKQRLLEAGAITALTQTSGTLAHSGSSFWEMEWPGSTKADAQQVFDQIATTYDFVKTTGVTLLEGRDFSPLFASDSVAVMVNESAVRRMNLLHPVGTVVIVHGRKSTIVGVLKDFIWGMPGAKVQPMVIAFNKGWGGSVTMRLNTANPLSENITKIETIVKSLNPAYPVSLQFVDRLYEEKLADERLLGILSNLFGGLAIFISCLGLFGLAAYSAEQRTKEIGVRKVMGASVANLIRLLSFSFLKMVVVAIIISVPVASYIMNGWLKSFEFHAGISWVMIVIVAAGTIGIALLTVSFQAYSAAKANAVDALKYE